MIYQIDKDYYVKVVNDFAKIEVIVNDTKDDIMLKPTNIKIENNRSLNVKTLSFDELKKRMLSNNHNTENSGKENHTSEPRYNKRYR